jgi:outer membrane protein assembly factor BamE (lipoprotein component of BamABCDE complex)
VPSAKRHPARLALLAISALLLLGAASGCSTTQEKAEKQQAQAKHILDARAERQKQKQGKDKPGKQDEKGS